jgi:hypothetical protein
MALVAACNSNAPAATTDSTKAKTDSSAAMADIKSPYSVMYSSKFAIDDPKNAETVLALWKAWDDNNIAVWKNLLADTVEVQLWDGFRGRLSRDSVVADVTAFRSTLSSSVDQVNAVMAVKSTDKNSHWALIWGRGKDTHKDGKIDSTELQETWGFNDAGKAAILYQFGEKSPAPNKGKK